MSSSANQQPRPKIVQLIKPESVNNCLLVGIKEVPIAEIEDKAPKEQGVFVIKGTIQDTQITLIVGKTKQLNQKPEALITQLKKALDITEASLSYRYKEVTDKNSYSIKGVELEFITEFKPLFKFGYKGDSKTKQLIINTEEINKQIDLIVGCHLPITDKAFSLVVIHKYVTEQVQSIKLRIKELWHQTLQPLIRQKYGLPKTTQKIKGIGTLQYSNRSPYVTPNGESIEGIEELKPYYKKIDQHKGEIKEAQGHIKQIISRLEQEGKVTKVHPDHLNYSVTIKPE